MWCAKWHHFVKNPYYVHIMYMQGCKYIGELYNPACTLQMCLSFLSYFHERSK